MELKRGDVAMQNVFLWKNLCCIQKVHEVIEPTPYFELLRTSGVTSAWINNFTYQTIELKRYLPEGTLNWR